MLWLVLVVATVALILGIVSIILFVTQNVPPHEGVILTVNSIHNEIPGKEYEYAIHRDENTGIITPYHKGVRQKLNPKITHVSYHNLLVRMHPERHPLLQPTNTVATKGYAVTASQSQAILDMLNGPGISLGNGDEYWSAYGDWNEQNMGIRTNNAWYYVLNGGLNTYDSNTMQTFLVGNLSRADQRSYWNLSVLIGSPYENASWPPDPSFVTLRAFSYGNSAYDPTNVANSPLLLWERQLFGGDTQSPDQTLVKCANTCYFVTNDTVTRFDGPLYETLSTDNQIYHADAMMTEDNERGNPRAIVIPLVRSTLPFKNGW